MSIPGEPNSQSASAHMTFVEVIEHENAQPTTGKVYHVLVNPASYSVKHSACYSTEQPIGGDEPSPTFNKILPGKLNIDLLFDATGSLGIPTLNLKKGVMKQVKEFLDMVFEVDRNRKQPKPLQIIWGPMEFFGRASSINITYSHFDAYGQPIRAVATCAFIQDKGMNKKAADTSAAAAPSPAVEPVDINSEKHLINGLLRHGDYLGILAEQSADDLPDTLRQPTEGLELFFRI